MESKMKYITKSLKLDLIFLSLFLVLGFSPLYMLSFA